MAARKKPSIVPAVIHEAPMINVGASVEAIAESRDAITKILDYDRDPTVLVEALKVLKRACSVRNVTISNCTFATKPRD